jgi:hypothetical protein
MEEERNVCIIYVGKSFEKCLLGNQRRKVKEEI